MNATAHPHDAPDGSLAQARETFIQGMARIAQFWGFPRGVGAVFGVVYLSPEPASLEAIATEAGVSKGAASTHVRSLERMGLLHKHVMVGDRRDFYSAETDFWKAIRAILREREQAEFAHALGSVERSLGQLPSKQDSDDEALFVRERLDSMQRFFETLDRMVATVTAMDDLRSTLLAHFPGGKK